jgi:hypothetical protein
MFGKASVLLMAVSAAAATRINVENARASPVHLFAEPKELRRKRNADRSRRAADGGRNGDVQARFHNAWHGCLSHGQAMFSTAIPRRLALAHLQFNGGDADDDPSTSATVIQVVQ